ncbi:MAG: PAS domain S-box protein [Chitinophagales bacterium]
MLPPLTDLKNSFSSADYHSHIAIIYETPAEWRDAIHAYFSTGLDLGERCVYLTEPGSVDQIRGFLHGSIPGAVEAEWSNQLLVTEVHNFNSDTITDYLVSLLNESKDLGFPVTRITWEIDRLLLLGCNSQQLLQIEYKLNKLLSSQLSCTVLCQYDRKNLTSELLKQIVMAHPYIVRNNKEYNNFYYAGSIDSLDDFQGERQIQQWLDNITREGQNYLRMRFISQVLDSSSQAFLAGYPDGTIITCNEAFCRLSGYSHEELKCIPWDTGLTPFEWRSTSTQAVDAVLMSGRPQFYEKEYISKQGIRIPVEVFLHASISKAGKIRYYYAFINDVTWRKKAEEALRIREAELRRITDNMLDMINVIDINGFLQYVSPSHKALLGYMPEELLGKNLLDYIHPDDLPGFLEVLRTGARKQSSDKLEVRLKNTSGGYVWFEGVGNPLLNNKGRVEGAVLSGRDITERKMAEEALLTSEKKLRQQVDYLNTLINNMYELFYTYDANGNISFINKMIREVLGYNPEDMLGHPLLEFVPEDYKPLVEQGINKRLTTGENGSYEVPLIHKDGSHRLIKLNVSPIVEEGSIIGGMVLAEDITEKKRAEEKLKTLSLFDSLTGLYNRTFFEEVLHRYESQPFTRVGIIMCDVDGLKLVNDTMGHDAGDALLIAAAKAIKNSFREKDIVARVGGDEFAVFLPFSTYRAVAAGCSRIKQEAHKYNANNPSAPLSISVGFSFRDSLALTKIPDLYKEADNNMYREKLHSSQSARSAIVNTLMKTLEARDIVTEGHTDRLQNLIVTVASILGELDTKLTDLKLFARFHDIGKIGTPDSILFKPGPLTPEETQEMRCHCEIGHRIALSSPDLVPIADWILKHHEWWNGKGYPLGLKEEDIPLECRLLSVVDAFDAMTSDRPYRKARPIEEALEELRRCAGTQFDPSLVPIFIQSIQQIREPASSAVPNHPG